MQKHSKKPKPVDELTLDVKSAKNIGERRRDPVLLTEDQVDQRAVSLKEYSRSRNELQRKDDDWVRAALKAQQKALRELKLIDEELYQKVGTDEMSLFGTWKWKFVITTILRLLNPKYSLHC
ncbi:hypothetical protein Y032_0933g3101 [Ancylostoma ceylanicum]|uniref:Large ribosomal subunit protein mL40 n=3 Tax=Ancylostoma ceylanicum TaxID=53326 RepID=A0A016W8E1_9BILA|nr:hypothetical protein Y032_0933g3101 [Ancylostoma ceylanicum]